MGLDGKVAIVTGAGSGFGAGIARRFAQDGAAVVLADIDANGGRAVAGEIIAAGGRAHFVQADVTRRADVEAMVAAAQADFGGLHILVNNAGISHRNQPLTEVSEEDFDRVYAINVKAIYKHWNRRNSGNWKMVSTPFSPSNFQSGISMVRSHQ